MRLAAFALFSLGASFAATPGVQDGSPSEIRITSAIFGAAQGSADVTPIVSRFVKPGLNELYAAPQWLEVDPAVSQTKQLVVFYEYRGEPHVLTTMEPGPVSYTILVERADPSRRRPAIADSPGGPLVVVDAYYGMGRMFQSVTPRVSALLRSDTEPFVIDDTVMGMRATQPAKILIVTYSYEGSRHTLVAWRGDRLGREALVANAAAEGDARRYSDIAPEWVSAAKPDPPREPGNPGPGVGRSPRRELGIAELLKALAELEAILPTQRGAPVTSAIAQTRSALADAQREIGYPYPPPASPPVQAGAGTTSTHLANATTALTTALSQLSSATAGRRGSPVLARSVSAINAALEALASTTPANAPPLRPN